MHLSLDVTLDYPGFSLRAEQTVTLSGITGLIGDSGSGKTTLLRIIAGLEKHARGTVNFNNNIWQNGKGTFVRPDRRHVSMVFQDLRLFDHLSVEGNLRYAAKRNSGPIREDEVIESLDLKALLKRSPDSLSGGEKQRVAIGRSLLSQPSLLLMDEPLTGLNWERKQEILPYIRQLPSAFSLPIFYVSHHSEEISRLCDNIYTMRSGSLHSHTSTVKREGMNSSKMTSLTATVLHRDLELRQTLLGVGDDSLIVAKLMPETSDRIRLLIKPEDVVISLDYPKNISSLNVKLATILSITQSPSADELLVLLQCGSKELTASVSISARQALKLETGQSVFIIITRIDTD